MYLKQIILLAVISVVSTYELMFTEQVKTYDIMENQPVSLICNVKNENIIIVETSDYPIKVRNLIVLNSVLIKEFENRFSFESIIQSADYDTEYRLSSNNITRVYSNYTYICIGRISSIIKMLSLNVFYKPRNPPSCKTNYYSRRIDEPLILQCITEEANPVANIYINADTHNQHNSYVRNGTHLIQQVYIKYPLMDIDPLMNVNRYTCYVYQFYPTDVEIYDFNTCRFTSMATTLKSGLAILVSLIVYLI